MKRINRFSLPTITYYEGIKLWCNNGQSYQHFKIIIFEFRVILTRKLTPEGFLEHQKAAILTKLKRCQDQRMQK